MNEMQKRLRYLLDRYANRTATKSEEQELFELTSDAGQDDEIRSIMIERMQLEVPTEAFPRDRYDHILEKVLAENRDEAAGPIFADQVITGSRGRNGFRISSWRAWSAAASVILLITCGWFYLSSKNNRQAPLATREAPATKPVSAILPGRKQAILTLADGSLINLDSVKTGTLTQQGNMKVVKGGTGELMYQPHHDIRSTGGYNTISVPRGGRYELVLSDGSRVWLNAASSLRYPTSFTGKYRTVTLTGEGYFEISRNEAMPFQVMVEDMTVQVLGTHFNVNAYKDENTLATTLLEGSVTVTSNRSPNAGLNPVVLAPGDQANLSDNGKLKLNRLASTEQVVAWKDNNFEFNSTPVPVIMRQIARWYDVDVIYSGAMPGRRLKGKFSRSVNLNQLVDMLQFAGVDVQIDNRKLVISDRVSNNAL